MQYKIENDTLIPAPVNFTTPDGRTICNFNLAPELMDRYGYTVTEAESEEWRRHHPAPPAPPRTTCTKYELITVISLRFPELLKQFRDEYEDSYELRFYWNTVQELDRTNADFQRFALALGISEEQIDAIFAALEA